MNYPYLLVIHDSALASCDLWSRGIHLLEKEWYLFCSVSFVNQKNATNLATSETYIVLYQRLKTMHN